MPIAEFCVVCSFRLPAVQRCDTRHCGSTCRVRALRARSRGIDLAALRSRYTMLRTHAASLSLAGNHHIPVAALSALAEQEKRADSLALQVTDARKRTAGLSAQVASAERTAQADRTKFELTIKELRDSLKAAQPPDNHEKIETPESASATGVPNEPLRDFALLSGTEVMAAIQAQVRSFRPLGLVPDREAVRPQHIASEHARANDDMSQLRTALAQVSQQLAEVTKQRDEARRSAAKLSDEQATMRQRVDKPERQREPGSLAPAASQLVAPVQLFDELIQVRKRIQALEFQIAHGNGAKDKQISMLSAELTSAEKHIQQLEAHKVRLAKEYEDQLAQVSRERDLARAEITKGQDVIRTLRTDPSLPSHASRKEDRYDPSQDVLVYLKGQELETSAARAHEEAMNLQRQTARPMGIAKSVAEQAYDAAMAARWSFIADPPKGHRKPIFWSLHERVLDVDSERYLQEQSRNRTCAIKSKEEVPMNLPIKIRRKKWW